MSRSELYEHHVTSSADPAPKALPCQRAHSARRQLLSAKCDARLRLFPALTCRSSSAVPNAYIWPRPAGQSHPSPVSHSHSTCIARAWPSQSPFGAALAAKDLAHAQQSFPIPWAIARPSFEKGNALLTSQPNSQVASTPTPALPHARLYKRRRL